LQLHLSGAHSYAVRGSVRGRTLRGPRARSAAAVVGVSADWPDGHLGGGGAPRALPVLRRSVVRHRPGLPARRRRAGLVKLIRFGTPGNERPGLQLEDGVRIDASAFGEDYD